MNCKGCGFWKFDMNPQTGAEIHRCARDASPRLDDETAAEDGCEYGVPPIEDVLRWLDHRLQGALMPGAERMYRAMRYYLEDVRDGEDEKALTGDLKLMLCATQDMILEKRGEDVGGY